MEEKKEMFHLVHGVCYQTDHTLMLDAMTTNINYIHVELPSGEVVYVTRALVTHHYSNTDQL